LGIAGTICPHDPILQNHKPGYGPYRNFPENQRYIPVMKSMPRPGFLDSTTLQGEEEMPAFEKKAPHEEDFYSLLFPWRESEMEGPRIQEGVFPPNAE